MLFKRHSKVQKNEEKKQSIKVPTWLESHIKECEEKRLLTVTLCSTTGNAAVPLLFDIVCIGGYKAYKNKE